MYQGYQEDSVGVEGVTGLEGVGSVEVLELLLELELELELELKNAELLELELELELELTNDDLRLELELTEPINKDLVLLIKVNPPSFLVAGFFSLLSVPSKGATADSMILFCNSEWETTPS
jgi:hypothetical protein